MKQGQKTSLAAGKSRTPLSRRPAIYRGSFEMLGVDGMEELVYRSLLSSSTATAEDIAYRLSLSSRHAHRLLDNIERKGLATHLPERPRRYIATSPALAADILAQQRQAELETARLKLARLKGPDLSETGEQERVVEIIREERAMLRQTLKRMHQSAQQEIVVFQRAPIIYGSNHAWDNSPTSGGVLVRSISDNSFIDDPLGPEVIRRGVEDGELCRVFPRLPVKMMIVDRRVALIPLDVRNQEGLCLLVHSSALLDALHTLFELVWSNAIPVSGNNGPEAERGRLPEDAGQLVMLLAAGFNDKAIAHELGVSASTVVRRLAELMKTFGARSRFQLGWSAALHSGHQT